MLFAATVADICAYRVLVSHDHHFQAFVVRADQPQHTVITIKHTCVFFLSKIVLYCVSKPSLSVWVTVYLLRYVRESNGQVQKPSLFVLINCLMKGSHAGLMRVDLLQVPDWSKDNAAGRKILQHHDLQVFESTLRLEGGSIHTDGQGCVLTHFSCCLFPNVLLSCCPALPLPFLPAHPLTSPLALLSLSHLWLPLSHP